jgi:hypothetical protein
MISGRARHTETAVILILRRHQVTGNWHQVERSTGVATLLATLGLDSEPGVPATPMPQAEGETDPSEHGEHQPRDQGGAHQETDEERADELHDGTSCLG